MSANSQPIDFPVDHVFTPLVDALGKRDVILIAPPGAGKSTRVPLHLLSAFPNKNIILLQPRRVVVRHLAKFLAQQLNEPIGQTVGYRMRGETKVSAHTRLTLVTEGVLTRMVQSDPELQDVDIILFDEFHERSVHADLGLAFAYECQQALRDDLRFVLMSATLEHQRIQTLLPDAELLQSEGKRFDVDIHYTGQVKNEAIVEATIETVNTAVSAHLEGDVLVFLPSAGLINRCASMLASLPYDVMPLYGAMPLSDQLKALAPSASGIRKIILATNIAETSLTIEGVRVVVDSGREQVPHYDGATATTSLSMRMISQASATQRAGRAGRVGPGHAYRLWSKDTQDRLEKTIKPALLSCDLSPHMLGVLDWGNQFDQLNLLDPPSSAQVSQSLALLERLGVADSAGRITSLGKRLVKQPFHPRISALLARVGESDSECAELAALMLESEQSYPNTWDKVGISQWLKTLTQTQRRIRKQIQGSLAVFNKPNLANHDGIHISDISPDELAGWLAWAMPERIAFQHSDGNWQLYNGKRFALSGQQQKEQGWHQPSQWCVVLEALESHGKWRVFKSIPVSLAQLQHTLGAQFKTIRSLTYDKRKDSWQARNQSVLSSIVYQQTPAKIDTTLNWADAWKQALMQGDLPIEVGALPLDKAGSQWLARVALYNQLFADNPLPVDGSHNALLACSERWLDDALQRCRRFADLKALPWELLLQQSLTWEQQQRLNKALPPHFTPKAGGPLHIDYSQHLDSETGQYQASAAVSGKLQLFFGIQAPVILANGRLTLTFELLSPAQRPIQKTQDLGQFWAGSYHQVAKEMRGRYPKHPWPEDPAHSSPTAGTKKTRPS